MHRRDPGPEGRLGSGTVDGKTEESVLADLRAAELPLPPALPLAGSVEKLFTFAFRPGDPCSSPTARWPT